MTYIDTKIETNDLSRFKARELTVAVAVLNAYAKQGAGWLGSDVTLCMNTRSHHVYLVDGKDNTAMLDDDGRLRKWWFCYACGIDGFDGEPHQVKGKRKKKEFEKYDGFCSRECSEEFKA